MAFQDSLGVTELSNKEIVPLELLVIADPSKSMVKHYLEIGTTYICKLNNEVVGVYILISTAPRKMEVANIAVAEKYRGKGIGKFLINDAINRSRNMGATLLEIGTGNSSLNQIGLYQKCGFRIVGVDRDFFRRNYEEKIIENGIECIDMIRLSRDL